MITQTITPREGTTTFLVSRTGRFITGEFSSFKFLSESGQPRARDITINYLETKKEDSFSNLLAFCKARGLTPLHPAILASACPSKPAFMDKTPSFTFWPTRNNLFGYARYYKSWGREINIGETGGDVTLEWVKNMWLATALI